MEDSIVLNLRGGGADVKRREARKRKFAHLQDKFPHKEQQGAKPLVLKKKSVSGGDHAFTEEVSKRKKVTSAAFAVMPKQSMPTSGKPDHGADQDTDAPIAESHEMEKPAKSQRFICFVGNLPYNATTAALASHFIKIQPSAIRHSVSKETGKSKGFAFLEFEGFDRMKTCLQLYHGSLFQVEGETQGKGQKEGGRRINVELTAGGGGSKSRERRSRLVAKNAKLQEERRRKAEDKDRKGRQKAKEAKESGGEVTDETGAIHPSRRARVANR